MTLLYECKREGDPPLETLTTLDAPAPIFGFGHSVAERTMLRDVRVQHLHMERYDRTLLRLRDRMCGGRPMESLPIGQQQAIRRASRGRVNARMVSSGSRVFCIGPETVAEDIIQALVYIFRDSVKGKIISYFPKHPDDCSPPLKEALVRAGFASANMRVIQT